ncbi:MAG: hypothetical protein ACFFDI_13300 [Promethearchaeota archaeon]
MQNKGKALALLNSFNAEYDFGDKPPDDVVEFAKCVGWEDIKEEETRSLGLWFGEYFMSGFLDKWDSDYEISKEDGKTVFKGHLNNVGLAIKYGFAWKIVSVLLFLNSNLSKELLLESVNDLECSIVLSRERYFKQAFQVLRNYCEICVSIMYFKRNKDKYTEWISDNKWWHFPEYRKMLNALGYYLANRETRYLHSRYSELNNSVHSQRSSLNMNILRLERASRDFDIKDILDWSKKFIGIAKFMTELYIRKYFD